MSVTRAEPAIETVPFVDLGRQHAALRNELREAFERVVAADAFILGAEVEAFEREFADFCEARHCVGVASGTAALELALRAAGVGPGDEVIVPAHTFIATPLAVLHAGATPVFCDVQPDTGLIDSASAQRALSERTAAIVPVHLYGQAADMDAVLMLARSHGLFVLEDAAQAHGARFDGRRVGSLGDGAAFSFYPSKNLGALGDGGAVCCDDSQLAARVRELRDLGQREKGKHVRIGRNERLHGMQAALLRVKLPRLDSWNQARTARAKRLRELLPTGLRCLPERGGSDAVHHLFPVRHTAARDRLSELLRKEGVQVGVHYDPAAHLHPALEGLPAESRALELPSAEDWAKRELSLPMFPELLDAEVVRIADRCQKACALIAGGAS